MSRRAAILATCLLALSGCSGGAADPGGTAPAPTASATAAPEGLDYAALGDSFSSGPLIPLQRNDASGCFRSTNNYPAYVAQLLDVGTYRDATCAGAITDDLSRQQPVLLGDTLPPPQLDALSEDTDLVTIGIGGNDFGLFGSIIGGCDTSAGVSCQETFTDATGVDTKVRDARRIRGRVAAALGLVRERAPGADVYVVGYPDLAPVSGTCPAFGLAADDVQWARGIQDQLNRSLRLAAQDSGATYVDVARPSRGHDVCAGSDAWVNGRRDLPDRALRFHPFQEGMAAVARLVASAVTGDEQGAVTGDAVPPAGSVVRSG